MRLFKQAELGQMTAAEMRREYSRLRKEALRRLAILKRENVLSYLDDVPAITTARGKTDMEVYRELREINYFLKNPFTKISWVKKFEAQMVETLKTQGNYNIKLKDIRAFNEFMGLMKEYYGEALFDSDRSAEAFEENLYNPEKIKELFEEIDRLNIDIPQEEIADRLNYMLTNLKTIKKIKPVKNNKEMSAKELKKRITIYDKNNRRNRKG